MFTPDFFTTPEFALSFLRWSIIILLIALEIDGIWKLFNAAGVHGWRSLIPIYRSFIMAKIAGLPKWLGLLTLIPALGLFVAIVIYIKFLISFKQSKAFVVLGGIAGPFFLAFYARTRYIIHPHVTEGQDFQSIKSHHRSPLNAHWLKNTIAPAFGEDNSKTEYNIQPDITEQYEATLDLQPDQPNDEDRINHEHPTIKKSKSIPFPRQKHNSSDADSFDF